MINHRKVDDFRRLLDESPQGVDYAIQDGRTLLYEAAAHNEVEMLGMLLDASANVNQATQSGSTALYIATQEGRQECMSMLLRAKAEVDQPMHDSWTPLFIATRQVCANPWNLSMGLSMMEMLLAAGAEVNQTLPDGATPLLMATASGCHKAMLLLIEAKANVEIAAQSRGSSYHLVSPLGVAVQQQQQQALHTGLSLDTHSTIERQRHSSTVRILLDAGADAYQSTRPHPSLIAMRLGGGATVAAIGFGMGPDSYSAAALGAAVPVYLRGADCV